VNGREEPFAFPQERGAHAFTKLYGENCIHAADFVRYDTKRMTSPEALEREKALMDELSRLSKRQSEALQTAVYMRMEPKMAAEYDIRAKRIGEICKLLGDYKSLW
jgi:hypothetical protein